MDCKTVFENACAAAKAAVPNPQDGYPCGFAWVKIRPARGEFVKWLKSQNIGRRDGYAGGYVISSYEVFAWRGQNMDVKEDACTAFVNVLRANGVAASVQSRID